MSPNAIQASRRLAVAVVCLFLSGLASTASAQQGSPRPSPIEELSLQIAELEANLNLRIDALRDQIEYEFGRVDGTLDVMGNAPKLNAAFCVDLGASAGLGGEGWLEGGGSWDSGPLARAALKGNITMGGSLGAGGVICVDVPITALGKDSVLNAKLMHQHYQGLPEEIRRQQLLAETKSVESDIASIAAFMENVGTNMTGQMESVLFGEMQDAFDGGVFNVAGVLTNPSSLFENIGGIILNFGNSGALVEYSAFRSVPFDADQMFLSTRSFLTNTDPCTMAFFNNLMGSLPGFSDLVCANNSESLVVAFQQLLNAVDAIETEVNNIGGAVTGSGEDVITAIEDLGSQVASVGSQVTAVGDQVNTARNQITGAVNTGFGAITPTLNTLGAQFTDFQGRLQLVQNLVDGLFVKIVTGDAFGRVEGLVESNLQLINQFTSSQLSALQSVILGEFNFIKPIIQTIEDIVNEIEDIVDDLP